MRIDLSHTVTVVVSLFGGNIAPRRIASLIRAWRQQDGCSAVVISEQLPAPVDERRGVATVAEQEGALYVRSYPDRSTTGGLYNIGRIRNAGLLRTTTTLVYFTDADVYPLCRTYLSLLRDLFYRLGSVSLCKPRFFRLGANSEQSLVDWLESSRPITFPDGTDQCLVDFADGRLQPSQEGQHIIYDEGIRYVCIDAAYAVLTSSTANISAETELLLKPDHHWGGTLVLRDTAMQVAGYSEGYYQWGCEDSDFHTKLKSHSGLIELRVAPERYPILHIEHPRPYNNRTYKDNEETHARRLHAGADAMIRQDEETQRSLLRAWVSRDHPMVAQLADLTTLPVGL